MGFDLAKKVVGVLTKSPGEKLTAREIAERMLEIYPEECEAKKHRSQVIDSNQALIQQIVAEVSSLHYRGKKYPKIKRIEDRPRKYYYTEYTDSEEIDRLENISITGKTAAEASKIKEHDLYPKLVEFLWSEFKIYGKRIDETRSKNSRGPKGNKWLYPDLVGMEDLSHDWNREIKDCVQEYRDKKTKLWSFEVKIFLNNSNVREVFFQTVSNSSWANFGYLVANEISGDGVLKELRILASLHGIGLITLDRETPSDSQIIIPAKERPEIDWDTANRLAEASKDFLNYIKLVRKFYQTGEGSLLDWDTQPIDD